MDWHPEHHSEGRYLWPRLEEWFELAALAVMVCGVLVAASLTATIVYMFQWGLV